MNNYTCIKRVGTLFLFPILFLLFGLQIVSAQTTYNSTDTPIIIDEISPNTITSTLIISGSGMTIGDLNVSLDISHSFIGDMEIILSKGGTSVILFNNSCSGNDNINMVVDEEGNTLVCPPFGGNSYVSAESLSALENISLDGTWILTIVDSASGDGGSLNSWGLIVTEPCLASAPVLSK